jgi:hypothetical protein
VGLGRIMNRYVLAPFGVSLIRNADLPPAAALTDGKLGSIERRLRQLDSSISRLRYNVDRELELRPSNQPEFLRFARLFSPRAVVGHKKVRLGRMNDGGYVMIDDFENIRTAFSFGVGDDASWDIEIAERGIRTFQFDDTISSPPALHPLLDFIPRKIVGTPAQDGETLGGAVERYGGTSSAAAHLLKIDIEGEEWPVFANCERKHLLSFAQIVCEFHGFRNSAKEGWYAQATRAISQLRKDFEVVHVHANNGAPFVAIANVPFPQILEVTFANRSRYEFCESFELFPTSIDQPNIPGRPDMFLGRFVF